MKCRERIQVRIDSESDLKTVKVPGRTLIKNFRTGFEILKKSGLDFFPLTVIKKPDPSSKLSSLSGLSIRQDTRSSNRRFALKPTALSLYANQPIRDLS
ncbi:Uncharacterized protein XB16_2764 [Leptospira santarosai]|uniref:Uncharacterized protein n=1 Tax=Leptospira santarosai TaxID=28183 RepID=A0A2P1QVZ5_9LEPT|nr:Uncharacterized protein XB16_2764 [Leptospira santarosai]